MKLCFAILLSAGLLAACRKSPPAPQGVTGRVAFQGVPPPEIPIQMNSACAKLQTNKPTTRHYVVGANGGLANVLVIVRAEFDEKLLPPVSTNAARMESVACQLYPYVLAVRAGQPVRFENNSTMLDNWHCTARINPEFNFAGTAGSVNTKKFEKPEDFIRIKGDVHPWRFGYVCVTGHPFFAVTGPDGNFTLPPGLPDGTYTLEARHLKAGARKRDITVRRGRAEPVEFTFTASAR